MKLHLPVQLFRAVIALMLAPFPVFAQSVEIPTEYSKIYLSRTAELTTYATNTNEDYWAFLLRQSLAFTPETNTSWSDSLVNNGNLIFTSNDLVSPVALSFSEGESLPFKGQSTLIFDTLSNLSFSGMNKSLGYSAGCISIADSGILTIVNVNDGLDETDDVLFENNTTGSNAALKGGAIYAAGTDSQINVSKNGDVTFRENVIASNYYCKDYRGGAIYAGGTLSFLSNENINFIGNVADAYAREREYDAYSYGGAIYANSELNIISNADITFCGNEAQSSNYYPASKSSAYGGAIYANSSILIDNNGDVTFSENGALYSSNSSNGGAIYACNTLTISNNANAYFYSNAVKCSGTTNDTSYSYGGAIYGKSAIQIKGNGEVVFSKNVASTDEDTSYVYGGAIYAQNTLAINDNGNVSFEDNTAMSYYGSVYESSHWAYGGAIYTKSSLTINNNADVCFIGNVAASFVKDSSRNHPFLSCGGAIYANSDLTVSGNDSVLFEANYERQGSSYRLRSIYHSAGKLSFSAKDDSSITIYDSVYSSGSAYFNGAYTDKDGKTQQATGDIIFSGKYTATHLNEILAANEENRMATDEEIQNSQTSLIAGTIYLQNGTLQVVDGASLNGGGLRASGMSTLLLRNGSMDHTGANFSFERNTSLELQGINHIYTESLSLSDAFSLTINLDNSHLETAALSLTGTLSTGTMTFKLNVEGENALGLYKIIALDDATNYDTSVWTTENVSVIGTGAAELATFGDLLWQGGVLYYVAGSIWNNLSGNGIWNEIDANWNNGSIYRQGQGVLFTDSGAGTVQLAGDLAPVSVSVSNTEEYTFCAAEGGGRLVGGMGITKSGTGTLTLMTANTYTGNTELQEGTLKVCHSTALGATANKKSALTTAVGTTLQIDNESQVILAAEGNRILGGVEVASGSSLEMKSSGYASTESVVNGTLIFTGQDASATVGTAAGNGSVQVTNSTVSFSDMSNFTGNLTVMGSAAQLTLDKRGYNGNGVIDVQSGSLAVDNRAALNITSGGKLVVSDSASVSAQTINIMGGATLSIGFEDVTLLPNGAQNNKEMTGFAPDGAVHTLIGAVVNADSFNLFSGSTLVSNGAHIDLNGTHLTLDGTDSEKINLVLTLGTYYSPDAKVVLFSNAAGLNLFYDDVFASAAEDGICSVNASNYFTGDWISSDSELVFENGCLYLTQVNSVGVIYDKVLWTDAVGNGLWNNDSLNWTQDSLSTNYRDNVAVIFEDAGAGVIMLEGELAPASVLVDNSNGCDYSWVGSGSLNGSMSLTKKGDGTLSISTANTYRGGTLIEGGRLVAKHADALGRGVVLLNGGTLEIGTSDFDNTIRVAAQSSLVVSDGVTHVLLNTISNTGTLSMSGHFIADALGDIIELCGITQVNSVGEIDTTGGFSKSALYGVQIATGNTRDQGSYITHGNNALRLGTDGWATMGGQADFSVYLLGYQHAAKLSDINASASAGGVYATDVQLSGGMLTADSVLTGTLTASGNSTIVAQNWEVSQSVINEGTLSISGNIIADGVVDVEVIDATRVSVDGSIGDSGFNRNSGSKFTLVEGGMVTATNLSITRNGVSYILDENGVAIANGTVFYDKYFIDNGHVAKFSEIKGIAVANGVDSTEVILSGGTLYADCSAKVAATSGKIEQTTGTLTGTLSGNTVLTVSGTTSISGFNIHTGGTTFNDACTTLSSASALGNGAVVTIGTNTLVADGEVILKGSILNSGTLTLSGCWNISSLELSSQAATRISINGNTGNSGFARSARYEAQVVLGGTSVASADLILSHDELANDLQLILGNNGVASVGGDVDYSTYYLTGLDHVSVSEADKASGSALRDIVMDGGNLSADASTNLITTGGVITVTDNVILSGTITDSDVVCNAGNYTAEVSADISGCSSLFIRGGNVILSGSNGYTGGTSIIGGSLTANNALALGSGTVTVTDSSLNLNNQSVVNDIVLNNGSLIGNENYSGNLSISGNRVTLESGYTLGGGKMLEIAVGGTELSAQLTLAGGTMLFKGAPLVVDGEVSFLDGTTTQVDLRQWVGQLTHGLTLAVFSSNVMGWTDGCMELVGMDGMSLEFNDETGVLTLLIPELMEETLTWLGGKRAVWQDGQAGWMSNNSGLNTVFEAGADVIFSQSGTVTIAGAVEPGSLIVAGDKAITFKADKKNPGRIVGESSLTKRGNGKLTLNDGNTYSGGTFIEAGTVTAGGATSFGRGDIFISGGALDLKSKAVLNDITLSEAAIIKGGKKYAGSYTQTGGELMKGSVLNIVESATISSGTVNGTLSGVGTVTIDGDVTLGESGKITTDKLLVDGSLAVSSKGLAMNTKTSAIEINGGKLSSKGKVSAASLNLDGGSLSLSGALSVKDLTLGSGTLTLDGAKLTTVKVGNTLTLEGGTTLNFGFSVKEKDVEKGKSYKVFTFKTIDASITDAALNELLGLGTDAATLAFDSKRKAITLTVTDADAWNEYAESVRNGTWTDTPSEDDELVESAGAFVLARPTAGVDPMLGKVADTLVQSTWGTAGASRAFGDTIAARGTHATALADGKAAAWISTMGGSSRISTDGAHAGADYTLTGAAFGMEARLSESSTVGLAIGNSWGKVSTFSAFPVDQDSTHQGIYGKHMLGSSTTLSWMAAHTRTESDANLAGLPCDWTQDALQLDARVDKLFAISDRTTVSAFVGMQYLATDKGECGGLSTGSLQNLRGEIGVSAAHKATDKAYVYGELSFVGDMVRHNPTATVGDYRSRGANPGRAGLNLSVGAGYQLNDSWSLNGSYSLELMQNQTSHSANVGATYSF